MSLVSNSYETDRAVKCICQVFVGIVIVISFVCVRECVRACVPAIIYNGLSSTNRFRATSAILTQLLVLGQNLAKNITTVRFCAPFTD